MSTNTEVAAIFAEIAAIQEILGESRFRVNAYQRAARALKDLPDDVAALVDDKPALVKLDGIGDATADKIIEYVATGEIAAHQKLRGELPDGLLDVLALPGLGPKTVQTLWKKADVIDIASLKAKLDDGTVEGLPRMGAKTVDNIRDAIAFSERSAGRVRLGKALPIAEAIVANLTALDHVSRADYAGSLRRGRETIGDIDILAVTTDPAALAEHFTTMDGVDRVLAHGTSKCSVRLDNDIQVDLRLVEAEAWGAALLYFTGSKEHNVRLRERAIARGFRLNEYGLFPADDEDTPPQQRGVTPVAATEESDIYAALELAVVPPELREDHGEFADESAGVPGGLDALITERDIRADLHMHTTASDGHLSIDELAELARSRGLSVIAVTDHSRSSAQANGLSVERLREHIAAVRAANERYDDLTILAGSEVDILADGHLDYDDDVLAELDIVVASPHVALRQDPATATKRLLAAIEHPLVDIIGHPTGRVINRREGLSPDLRALAEAAAAHDTALEINANHLRLDLRDTHVRLAHDCGALIAIDTDTHRPDQIAQLRYGVLTARRGALPRDRCVNTWDDDRLLEWLRRNRG